MEQTARSALDAPDAPDAPDDPEALEPSSLASVTDDIVGFLTLLKKGGETHMLRVAADLDLSFSQLRAMFVLADCPQELAVHELAAQLGSSVATAGRAVQTLYQAGIVTRREEEGDRRVKRVALSEHGREMVTGFAEAHRAAVRECLEPLSDSERELLSRALAPILARGARQVPDPSRQAD